MTTIDELIKQLTYIKENSENGGNTLCRVCIPYDYDCSRNVIESDIMDSRPIEISKETDYYKAQEVATIYFDSYRHWSFGGNNEDDSGYSLSEHRDLENNQMNELNRHYGY